MSQWQLSIIFFLLRAGMPLPGWVAGAGIGEDRLERHHPSEVWVRTPKSGAVPAGAWQTVLPFTGHLKTP
jgi:hypothetical protein